MNEKPPEQNTFLSSIHKVGQTSPSVLKIDREEEALVFLERLLNTTAIAKVKISLYPEKHPFVQELLVQLHQMIIATLKNRTVLTLEFQPGRIIVDKKYVVGEKENIARFSKDMYRLRIARLRFDNFLDLESLFQFLKFITTDVEILQKRGDMGGKPLQKFRGIHLEELDYASLMKIRGESIFFKSDEEKDISVLDLLFYKKKLSGANDTAFKKYFSISDQLFQAIENLPEDKTKIPHLDSDLSPERQASGLFRNIVEIICSTPLQNGEVLKKELAESLYKMPYQMRSELLIEELLEKGKEGNLFSLFAYLSPEQIENILKPLKGQAKTEGLSELNEKIEKINKAIHFHNHYIPTKKEFKKVPVSSIVDKEFLSTFYEDFSPFEIGRHYEQIINIIFKETDEVLAFETCMNYFAKNLETFVNQKDWHSSKLLLSKILSTLNEKKLPQSNSTTSFIKIFEKKIYNILSPQYLQTLLDNDSSTMDNISTLLNMFDITPEQIFRESLPIVENRLLRKKILRYITESGKITQDFIQNMLNHKEWFVTRNAVTLIRESSNPNFLPFLEKTIMHPNLQVRKETILALANMKSNEAFNILIQIYNELTQPLEIRVLALECMGTFREKRSRDIYLSLLHDERAPTQDFKMRITGIKQLGYYKDLETVQALVQFIKRPHLFHKKVWGKLKKAAFEALKQIDTDVTKKALIEFKQYFSRK